jgi:histidine triad (HIT) family protein
MNKCVFCDIVSGKVPTRKVYENEDIIGFMDLNPQAPLHILVVPKKHITGLSQIKKEDCTLLGKLHLAVAEITRSQSLTDFRVVINNGRDAGQTVDHLHFHVLGGRRMMWPPG